MKNWTRFYYLDENRLEVDIACVACKRPASTKHYQYLKGAFNEGHIYGYGYERLNRFSTGSSPVEYRD